MVKYLEAIEGLPVEFKLPLIKAFEFFKEEIAETVKRSDFEDLKSVVCELVEAQRDTHKEVGRLDRSLQELAEAQRRTEQRVGELAEAQRRTEQRVGELAEAQRRTEQRVGELAEALVDTRKEVGGLSHTIGYTLENEAYKALPAILKKQYNLIVDGRLARKFIEYPDGREDEINIIGSGSIDGRRLNIIGETKSQLSLRDMDNFLKRVKRLEEVIPGERFLLMVTHSVKPSVIKHAEAKKIAVFISYEF